MILMENGGELLLKIQNTQGNYSIFPKLIFHLGVTTEKMVRENVEVSRGKMWMSRGNMEVSKGELAAY
jgi:hypothetical protein